MATPTMIADIDESTPTSVDFFSSRKNENLQNIMDILAESLYQANSLNYRQTIYGIFDRGKQTSKRKTMHYVMSVRFHTSVHAHRALTVWKLTSCLIWAWLSYYHQFSGDRSVMNRGRDYSLRGKSARRRHKYSCYPFFVFAFAYLKSLNLAGANQNMYVSISNHFLYQHKHHRSKWKPRKETKGTIGIIRTKPVNWCGGLSAMLESR